MSNNKDIEMVIETWDKYHPIYMECILRDRPDFHGFFADGGVETDFEFELLGDIQGLKLLDTCCACDARQAFSWTNLGANVTACDISPVAINIAKDNAKKIGLNVNFQVADARTLEPINDNEYDIVYATYIGWYQDIEMGFKNWFRVLKPGGRLLYVGLYPATVSKNYYDRTPDYYIFEATPVGRKYGVNINIPTVNFHHTLSDIVIVKQ
ncbi:class I SAM-dependent methyltransferase [Paenibacillus hodogayensis]|uniref:Class I SAM-dependent methyltransferase n=1 Tax=Paenibacillus hodogayensis TaxID=279208 RepID=A0ABV5W1V1_9BACL